MHRRAFIGTAATLATSLVAGCTRDGGDGGGEDGASGDGDGGGSGPYGMIGTGGIGLAAGDADGAVSRSASRRSGGPALGPEPSGDADG